ncbi:MAG: Ca2+-binding RTX toxin-like protein [Paracoccaceae bacterium]
MLYYLPTGNLGTINNDIMAGTLLDDVRRAGAGDDYLTGNDGNDRLVGGTGADYLLGGTGNDKLNGQADDDHIYGGTGHDIANGGRGFDFLYLDEGNDIGRGGADNDYIYGQNGNDRLVGGTGQDMLSGGRGDDTMIGGAGGDTYRYGYDLDNLGTMRDAGHDVINDKGDAATWNNFDRIELFGYYGPGDGSAADAYARLSFDKVGDDMVITTADGAGSVTVLNQFGRNKFAIEELHFNAGYWEPKQFKILDSAKTDIGDDRRTNSDFNEVLFGTDADDLIFGGSGSNLIWLGDGADTLIYKESDPAVHFYGTGGGSVNDIVEDFDITMDQMDFREVGTATSISNLLIVDNGVGNATVNWYSGDIEIANIFIELRGVTAADLTVDHFAFG